MDALLHDALIFGAFMVSMLLKDLVFTIETKANADGKVWIAAIADPLGDGLSSLTNIFTIAIVAAGMTRGAEVAQIVGNMAGGCLGVYAGNHVSMILDSLLAGYHRRPTTVRLASG